MASKKEKSPAASPVQDEDKGAAAAKSSAKKGAPSVASFLSKISTPKGQGGAASPAKGLLGGVTRDDLRNVGTFEDGRLEPPATTNPGVGHGAGIVTVSDDGFTLSIELQSGEGAGGSGRKAARVAVKHQVGVRGVFAGDVAGEFGEPTTRDLSAGGVFVETADLLEVGDPVVLSFPLPDGKRLVVNGRVRWVTPFGNVADPTPGMGIEFVGVDQVKRDKIDAVLARAGG
jgi:uncharacterized protein (TIGR02266 family)